MPPFAYNADTEKEATIKVIRVNWQGLKTSHAAVLKTANITFSDSLGKTLDNRAPLWKALHDAKTTLNVADKNQLAAYRTKLNALKANAKAGHTVVATYYTAIKKLNVPATKMAYVGLEKALAGMERAFQYDINYAESM